MKLSDLKNSLLEQFFDEASSGLLTEKLPELYESLQTKWDVPTSGGAHSSDPSKAFAQFTKERCAVLTINEEDGMQKRALFSAIKEGTQVHYSSLTKLNPTWVRGDLKIIKDALRQAKNINDDVDFHVVAEDFK